MNLLPPSFKKERKCSSKRYRQLTSDWLKTRRVKNREIGFLIRPMEMEHEEETKKFFAYLNGKLIGFIFYDPIYSDNQITGSVPNISRFSNKFKPGIFSPLMIHAIEVFKQDGIPNLNLGLCPLVVDDGLKGLNVTGKKVALLITTGQ